MPVEYSKNINLYAYKILQISRLVQIHKSFLLQIILMNVSGVTALPIYHSYCLLKCSSIFNVYVTWIFFFHSYLIKIKFQILILCSAFIFITSLFFLFFYYWSANINYPLIFSFCFSLFDQEPYARCWTKSSHWNVAGSKLSKGRVENRLHIYW